MQSAGADRTWPPAEDKLSLILIGKTGSGKSASGNTILGRSHFLSKLSGSSVTKVSELGTSDYPVEEEAGRRERRRLAVVDLPGFGDTHLSEEQVIEEVTRCVALSAPGPHAFLLTVPLGRFTEEENAAVTTMAKVFGEVALRNHTVVLFTRGDDLEVPIEEYLAGAPASLKSLIDRCGGRYHVLNNRASSDVEQVHQLIRKVEQMVDDSGGCYTNAMYREAEAAIQEENRLRRRRVPEQGVTADDGEVERSTHGRLYSTVPLPLSPSVLQRVKVVVAAMLTGVVVGAVCGAVVPLLAGRPTVAIGGLVGGCIGGFMGAVAGLEAASLEEGVQVTLRQVGEWGGLALGAAAGVGVLGAKVTIGGVGVLGAKVTIGGVCVLGTGAAIGGVCVLVTGTSIGAAAGAGPAPPPQDVAGGVGPEMTGGVATPRMGTDICAAAAELGKAALRGMQSSRLEVKVYKGKVVNGEGMREESYTEINWNK